MQYDITVIGAGPGGYVAAVKAAQCGKRVCLVEKEHMGGVCLNVGCIPTKTLLHTAAVIRTARSAASFAVTGIDPTALNVDLPALQKRKNAVIRRLSSGIESLMKKNNITVLRGTATFLDRNTISVNDESIASEYFIIATGSQPFRPSSIHIHPEAAVMDSTQALQLDKIPPKLAIIGGGVIGIEFAHLYSALGSEVHVFEAMEQILPMMDETVVAMARMVLEQEGIVFHTSTQVLEVSKDSVLYQESGQNNTCLTQAVLMAVGRTPNIAGLGLDQLGIRLERGAVHTDNYLRTNLPNIYAIGDANGHLMLAHTASSEAHVAVTHICTGSAEPIAYDRIPSCIYIQPELAAIGMTERQARNKGLDISVGFFPMAANGRAQSEGESEGGIKVIIDRQTGELYGVHMMGSRATDLMGEAGVLMHLEATAEMVTHVVHPHPTISEVIPEAILAAISQSLHT